MQCKLHACACQTNAFNPSLINITSHQISFFLSHLIIMTCINLNLIVCVRYRSRRPIGLGNRRTVDPTIGSASCLTLGDQSKRWGRNSPRSGTRIIINISRMWVHINWDISISCTAFIYISIIHVSKTKFLHLIMIIW